MGAKLAGRIEAVYCDDLSTIPLSLIFQHSAELAPGCIRNRFCQMVILYHVLGSQILQADHIILPDQSGRQLLEHIVPLCCYLLMEPCHFADCLCPPVTPLCFSGELPLGFGKLLFDLAQILVVWEFCSIGGNSKGLDAHIQTDNGSGRWKMLNVLFQPTAQGYIVFTAC